jgi:hypothetical protein
MKQVRRLAVPRYFRTLVLGFSGGKLDFVLARWVKSILRLREGGGVLGFGLPLPANRPREWGNRFDILVL